MYINFTFSCHRYDFQPYNFDFKKKSDYWDFLKCNYHDFLCYNNVIITIFKLFSLAGINDPLYNVISK